MPKVIIHASEWYPVYSATRDLDTENEFDKAHDVDEDTLARWEDAQRLFYQVQEEMRRTVVEFCPECDHPQFRHQEWSQGWDTWGCLERVPDASRESGGRTCRCQHGIPEERKAEVRRCDGSGLLPRSMGEQSEDGTYTGLCISCQRFLPMYEVIPPSKPEWPREFRLAEHDA